ncbi:MAG: LCP family protein [Actinomycetota bacterium]
MSDRNDLQQGREGHPHVRHAFLAATASISSLVLVVSALSMATYFWAREKIDVIPIDARSPGSTLAPDILDDPCTTRPCNYLLLGSDSRAGLPPEEYGVDEQVGVYRSDTIIVVRTDPREGRAVILHFPRDLWVEIPGRGPGRINTAFGGGVEGGGPQLVARTIRDVTGLQINHVLYVDLEGFRGVIDAIGGIPMCVDRPLYDQLAGLDIRKAGCFTFDGRTALAYVRARHLPGDCIPDFARIARQQQFLRALLAKILTPGQLVHLPSTLEAVVENIRVDPGLRDLAELLYLSEQLKGISTGDADFRVVPTVPDSLYVDGVFTSIVRMVQPDARALFRNLRQGRALGELGREQPSTPPSPANIRVAVYDDASNGTANRVFSVVERSGFDVSPGILDADALAPAVEEAILLFRPGAEDMARVVQGFVPNLEMREVPDGFLGEADVGLVITRTFQPERPGAEGASPPAC